VSTPRPTRPPFTSQLRAHGEPIRVGAADAAERWTLRVQMPEVWDAVRFSTPPSEPALSLKVLALEALFPDAAFHDDFVLKLHGFEVLDENASLAEIGAADGSILLLTHRRRRPVR
jgi:hypothetical protein